LRSARLDDPFTIFHSACHLRSRLRGGLSRHDPPLPACVPFARSAPTHRPGRIRYTLPDFSAPDSCGVRADRGSSRLYLSYAELEQLGLSSSFSNSADVAPCP